jgi:Zn-dependent peptidase ImmA (M78 family)
MKVRQMAEEVLKQTGTARVPVPVEQIVKKLGIELVHESLGPEVSGLIVLSPAGVKICVNQDDPEPRRRFTIAHELGHHVLKHQFEAGSHVHVDRGNVILYREKKTAGFDGKEREANKFAAELLMPTELVKEHARMQRPKGPLMDLDVELLAAMFQVSQQAMTIQLIGLNLL